jgi:hypothetical protein
MTTLRYNFHIQLKDAFTGAPIVTAGGVAYVAKNGLASKQACTDKDGTALSNPVALVRGSLDIWCTSLTNAMVDLYIQCPGGQFVVARNISPSGPNEIPVNTVNPNQCMVIPWAQADFTAATETDTGFDCPAANTAVFLADSGSAAVRVVTIDATETIDVGTDSTDSGDADGFISAAAIGVAGIIQDNGALLGTLVGHLSAGKSITITTSTGSDTGLGFIYLNYRLMN